MDIAREEVTDGGMNREGVPKTGGGNDGRRDDDTVISPFKPKEKSAAHFPVPPGLAFRENELPYRATPQEPNCLVALRFTHSKQRGGELTTCGEVTSANRL